MKEAYTGCTVETMQPATMNAPTSARMEQEIVALKQKQNSTHSKKVVLLKPAGFIPRS